MTLTPITFLFTNKTQLLTVQQMEQSTDEDDQEIAENIQNRIFYEEHTHDQILGLVRTYKDQGRGYLDSVTELAHVFVRMLEGYSKQNADMQIRSKRRAKKKAQQSNPDNNPDAEEHNSEDEVETAKRTTNERKFDFQKFAGRLSTQGCVNTYISLLKGYQDLSAEQLKRAHRYFYRVAFKLDICTMLFRVDIIQLLYNMIKGPSPLSKEAPTFRDWEELSRQIFKKLTKRLKEHPELMVEMLFSKIPSTVYYLEHGQELETYKSTPRAPVEWEVKPGIALGDRISLVTEVIVSENKFDAVTWIKDELARAITERKAWEDANAAQQSLSAVSASAEGESSAVEPQPVEAVQPPMFLLTKPSSQTQTGVFKSPKIRLLLSLLSIERLDAVDEPGATYLIPSATSSEALSQSLSKIHSGERGDTLNSYNDAKPASTYLRRKAAAVETDDDGRVVIHSDSEGEESFDEATLFPLGPGPTARKPDHEPSSKGKKLKRLKRNREEPDDEEKLKKAKMRREKEKDKRKKIKSDAFIHESDEEWDAERDAEFFKNEELWRAKMGMSLVQIEEATKRAEMKKRKGEDDEVVEKKKKRRLSASDSEDEDQSDDERRVEKEVLVINSDSDSDSASDASDKEDSDEKMSDDEDTPLTSQPKEPVLNIPGDANKENEVAKNIGTKDSDDDSEDDIPVKRVAKRNVRGGFVMVDSDSE
jgi:replication fork protection complex subunit Tof1/Swi1